MMLVMLICGLALGVGLDELTRGEWVGGALGFAPIVALAAIAFCERGDSGKAFVQQS